MQHFIFPGQFGDSVAPFPIYIGEPAADAHPSNSSKQESVPGVATGLARVPRFDHRRRPGGQGPRELSASVVDQLTLADFIACGAYDRHVRRMRQSYRRRRDLLVGELARRAPHIRLSGIAAGLHAVLDLRSGSEEATLRAARPRPRRARRLPPPGQHHATA